MATILIEQKTCDLTGVTSTPTEPVETVSFGIDGGTYEMELTAAAATGLRAIIEEYRVNARKMRSAPRSRAARSTTPVDLAAARSQRDQNRAIRDWAARNGYRISGRGRLPAEVMDAFRVAHTAPGGGDAVATA